MTRLWTTCKESVQKKKHGHHCSILIIPVNFIFLSCHENWSGTWFTLLTLSRKIEWTSLSWKHILIPYQHICVDEYPCGRKGWSAGWKCYETKLYMLCESSTGYLCKFIVYTGPDRAYPDPGLNFPKGFGDCSNPSNVVLPLIKNLYNYGYTMVINNLYASPELFSALYH